MRHFRLLWLLLGLIFTGFWQPARANVAVKTGNFFVSYVDVSFSGGFAMTIERIYNSKTPFVGIFGCGWGNPYEIYLTTSADGSVIVHEYGGGAENRFNPPQYSEAELLTAIDKMVKAAREAAQIQNDDDEAVYRRRLARDATFRNDEWDKWVVAGGLERRILPVGTRLFSDRFAYQFLTRVENGFRRDTANGRTEFFNDNGQLIKITDQNHNALDFAYGDNGRIRAISDNFKQRIELSYNAQGQVVEIRARNKRIIYRYNDSAELIYSRDVDGNVYQYFYSTDNRHNLRRILYTDSTTMEMTYYDQNKHENIHTVKDRDGTLKIYDYFLKDSGDFNDSSVTISTKDKALRLLNRQIYQYRDRLKSDGDFYTEKVVSIVDGERSETHYSEAGLPLMIRDGSGETRFQYDGRNNLLRKESNEQIIEMKYLDNLDRITEVRKWPKKLPQQITWSKFDYDVKGNLIRAEDSTKQVVDLSYDEFGRMNLIASKTEKITLSYNSDSKLMQISGWKNDKLLGNLISIYDSDGQIKSYDCPQGRDASSQIASLLGKLVAVVSPAGVSLGF